MDSLTRTLFDLTPAGAMLLRPLYDEHQHLVDFAYEQLNLAGQHMLRLPAQPAQTFLQLFPMALNTGVFAFYREAFLTGRPDFLGVDYRHDGLDAYYQLAAQRAGEYLVVSFTDTADRRQGDMVTALQRSHQAERVALAEAGRQGQHLVRLLEQVPAAMAVVVGPDFVYERFNPLYAAIFFGRPQVGRPMLEAVPEVMDHPAYLSLHAVYHQGIIFQQQEVLAQLTRPGDGVLEDRYFNLTQQPRYNQQGQIDGVFMFFNEVTEQVQTRQRVLTLNQQLATANDEQATALEGQWSANMALRQTQQQLHYLNQELEQRVQERTEQLAAANAQLHLANEELHSSNTQLRRTNADLDNFIYTASHDLKAPISNIEGLLTLLPGLLPAAAHAGEVADLLTLMQGSIKRFQRTINHLTDVGRLQAEFAQPAQALDLAAAVEDVRLDLLPQLTQAQGQLEVAVEGIQVRVFSAKNLRSLLYNLLSNAVKYGAPNRPPRVRLSCAAEGSQLVLRVQDNGLGLNERQQAKLFQLFQRLHDHVDGTGVGLYAVKKIVKNAGGTIAVESQPGVGTTFILVFPA